MWNNTQYYKLEKYKTKDISLEGREWIHLLKGFDYSIMYALLLEIKIFLETVYKVILIEKVLINFNNNF